MVSVEEFEHLRTVAEPGILMDAVIIVSVSIMPLINITTIAHFINDVEAEERSGRCPNDSATSQLILELSKHLSANAMRLFYILM